MTSKIGNIAANIIKLFPLFYQTLHVNKQADFTHLQYHILENLFEAKKGVSMKQMAQKLDICKQQLTPLICKLEEKKCIRKTHDEKDRRIINLTLLEKGKEIVEKRWEEMSLQFCGRLRSLDDSDIADLDYATSKMIQIMEKWEN